MAIGAMLGFLVPTFVADYTPEPSIQARVAESPVARQFILAYLANDKSTLETMGTSAEDRLQSARFRAEFARVDQPVHLGSWVGGGFSLHAYAAHVIRADGTDDLLSWRVATGGGQVGLIDPPAAGQKP
jgi:hypothetical protein